jgi:exopolysaccharide biosynthesis protein
VNALTSRRGIAAACAAAAVAFIAVAWLVARSTLPGRILALPPGYALTYDRVTQNGGTLQLDGVRITAPGGALTVTASAVSFSGLGFGALFGNVGPLDVALRAPHVRIARGAEGIGELEQAAAALRAWKRWTPGMRARIDDGAVEIAGPSLAGDVTFDGIAGTLTVLREGVAYDLQARASDGTASGTLHGVAARGPGGAVVHSWNADAVPLAPLLALFVPPATLSAQGGTLRDVALTLTDPDRPSGTPLLSGSAHLDGANLRLGTGAHEIRGLHGGLTFDAAAIASPLLAGTVDGIPLEIAGEVDDVHGAPLQYLAQGNGDLRTVPALLDKVASQPAVRTIRIEPEAPGIVFAQYATQESYGPLVITAVTIDPQEPTVRFNTAIAGDHITSGGERTSTMGVRTGAVVGVNGDYYDIGGSWAPQGVLIRSGMILRTPIERMALTIHRNKHVTFQEYRLQGTARIDGDTLPLTQINSWPAGDVTLMTPEYGDIPPAPDVTLARLEPLDAGLRRFRVVSAGLAIAKTPATYALALGKLIHAPKLRPGTRVDLAYDLVPSANDAVAAIGGGPLLLRDGAWYEDPHPPAPDERTVHWAVVAVGRMADDTVMIFQVDGRHPERSIGMTRPDFAALMHDFGVVDAMALDSGGSSAIVSRAPGDHDVSLRNRPSDNDGERWISDGFFVYSSAPAGRLLDLTPSVKSAPLAAGPEAIPPSPAPATP